MHRHSEPLDRPTPARLPHGAGQYCLRLASWGLGPKWLEPALLLVRERARPPAAGLIPRGTSAARGW